MAVECVLGSILEFARPNTAFDAEAASALIAAYEQAIVNLHDKGQPAIVRQIIAKRIVKFAASGERSPDRLCEAALRSLGISFSPSVS